MDDIAPLRCGTAVSKASALPGDLSVSFGPVSCQPVSSGLVSSRLVSLRPVFSGAAPCGRVPFGLASSRPISLRLASLGCVAVALVFFCVVFLGLSLLSPNTAAASPETASVPQAGLGGGTPQAVSTPPPPNIEDSLFASPTTHDHVGRVVVPVKINGQGPFRFIVDTGANHSTISPELVRVLALKTGKESLITLDGITGAAKVSYVSIDRLQAGDLTIEDTTLPVVLGSVLGGADGILGAAGMSQKSLLIDFQRNRVAIASHMESSARTRAIKIRAVRIASGLIVLDTVVAGVRAQAVLDTGSERTLGNMALREALRSQQLGKKGFVAQLTSVYGATEHVEPGEVLAAPTISIDTLRITDVHIVYGNFHIFKIWNMQDKPAMILGMDILGTVASLNIDFKNQYVYVGNVPPANKDFLSTPHDLSNVQSMKK